MSARARRTRRSAAPSPATGRADPCPCGLPAPYGECCGRLHTGAAAAATAEQLMRSRYSAFAVRDTPYLLRTWAPATRPTQLTLDQEMCWTGLEILSTTDGSAFHTTGTVTFRAHFTQGGAAGVMEERSRFERASGAWVYLDGTVSSG